MIAFIIWRRNQLIFIINEIRTRSPPLKQKVLYQLRQLESAILILVFKSDFLICCKYITVYTNLDHPKFIPCAQRFILHTKKSVRALSKSNSNLSASEHNFATPHDWFMASHLEHCS